MPAADRRVRPGFFSDFPGDIGIRSCAVIFELLKMAGVPHDWGMSEPVAPTVMVLLCVAVGLLMWLLALLFGVSRRLWRMEKRMAEASVREEAELAAQTLPDSSVGGAFETFLNEDSTRRYLPKSEKFAAYRRWRQENGLNWSNS